MKNWIWIGLFIILPNVGMGQNLIPNAGFEDITVCNNNYFFSGINNWYNEQVTPDNYHVCMPASYGILVDQSTHGNGISTRFPYQGDAFAGFGYIDICCDWDTAYGEMMGIRLNKTLDKDTRYCFSVFISLSDSSFHAANILQAYFSTDSLANISSVAPQVTFGDINVFLSHAWIEVNGSFVADGTENFLHLGYMGIPDSFYIVPNPSYSGYNPYSNVVFSSYYFIDDVSLYEIVTRPDFEVVCLGAQPSIKAKKGESYLWKDASGSILGQDSILLLPAGYQGVIIVESQICHYTFTDTLEISPCENPLPVIPDIITPNGDGVNDAFAIGNLPPYSALTVYNRWGAEVFRTDNYNNDWRGQTRTLGAPAQVTDGVYFYVLTLPSGMQKTGLLTVTGQ